MTSKELGCRQLSVLTFENCQLRFSSSELSGGLVHRVKWLIAIQQSGVYVQLLFVNLVKCQSIHFWGGCKKSFCNTTSTLNLLKYRRVRCYSPTNVKTSYSASSGNWMEDGLVKCLSWEKRRLEVSTSEASLTLKGTVERKIKCILTTCLLKKKKWAFIQLSATLFFLRS